MSDKINPIMAKFDGQPALMNADHVTSTWFQSCCQEVYAVAEKINEVLGTEGLPERTETPSDEWCQTVKVELVKQSMTVNELAKQLDVSRDRLSLVINGKMMNEAIVSGVNNLLGINLVAVPADK